MLLVIMTSLVMPIIIMLGVTFNFYVEFHNSECHYAQCHYAVLFYKSTSA
jgi:hypothetical protein